MLRSKLLLSVVVASLTASVAAQPANDNVLCGDKDWAIAVSACSKLIESKAEPSANLGKAYFNRAIANQRLGRHRAAVADATKALAADPSNHLILITRAESLTALADYASAIADATRSIQLDQRTGGVAGYLLRARARQMKGEHAEALPDFNAALSLLLGAMGTRSLAKTDDPSSSARIRDGFGKDIDISASGLHGLRAHSLAAIGRRNEALADADKAAALAPQSAIAYAHRGELREKIGDLAGAMSDYNHALSLTPTEHTALAARGALKARSGKHAEGMADLNDAVRLAPEEPWYRTKRSAAFSVRGDTASALADAEKAVELAPALVAAYFQRANVYLKTGKLDLAASDATKMIELNSASYTAYQMRGLIHKASGRKSEALADLNKALALNPALSVAKAARDGLLAGN